MANPLAPHIQQRVDEDTANVPSFHGNFKDVITLPVFINRIDMGIETLLWTQQVAFTYFSNALKDVAAAWRRHGGGGGDGGGGGSSVLAAVRGRVLPPPHNGPKDYIR